MKLLIVCVLLTLALGYHRFNYKNAEDMLEYLGDEDHHIYVLFFYNGDVKQSEVGDLLKKRNDEERMRVQNIILEKYPQVAFTDIETSTGAFDGVVELFGFDQESLGEFPTIAVLSDGNGQWVHGPNAAPFAEEIVINLTQAQDKQVAAEPIAEPAAVEAAPEQPSAPAQ